MLSIPLGDGLQNFVFFGKPGDDLHEAPKPRNLDLASWWAAMIEIPAIVLCGAALSSLKEGAQTGAEFAALSRAIFTPDGEASGPLTDANTIARAIAEANAILDTHAPRFDPADSE